MLRCQLWPSGYLSRRFHQRAEIKPPSAMPAPIHESSGRALVDGKFCSSTAPWSAFEIFDFGDSCVGMAKQLMHISRRIDSVWQVFFMVFTLITLLYVAYIALGTAEQILRTLIPQLSPFLGIPFALSSYRNGPNSLSSSAVTPSRG